MHRVTAANIRLTVLFLIAGSSGVALAQAADAPASQPPPALSGASCTGNIRLRRIVVSDSFPGGYQVAAADMNADGRPDILALGEHPGTVDWFKNPGDPIKPWARHPISTTATQRNIDLAAHDIDGDGPLDVAVASDFELGRSDRGGTVSWLRRRADDANEWERFPIHAEPTAHRIRWADIDGDARKELITVPIAGRGAKLPGLQEARARITCHWIPERPDRDPWRGQIIDERLTVVHGVFVHDWDGDGRDELLTASNQGVHLHQASGTGAEVRWSRRQLAAGHAGEPPGSGASEICVGRAHDARFLATIEPWHGHEVAVYPPPPAGANPAARLRRAVIDDSLRAGHALCCADLDGDGCDEIIAGYRGPGTSLYGYRRDTKSGAWHRFVIDDGGVAAQGCAAADVNSDGRIDLIATGGSTHNVTLYLNETRPGAASERHNR